MLLLIAVIALATFRDYGLGWDDYTHAEYADLLLRMFPAPPVKVRGKDLAEVLTPAYDRLAADDGQAAPGPL